MGMGHVPQEPVRAEGARAQLQGSQRRGTPSRRSLSAARGHRGEALVAQQYVAEGWVLVARNFRSTRGELDVVAIKDGVLVVCEVKTRIDLAMGHPFDSITTTKQLRVRRATADYLAHLRATDPRLFARIRTVRFDAASVVGNNVERLTDAF